MDRYRLKNVIILILLLVNGFLLSSLALRETAEQDAFRRTAEQLSALFEADGMALDVYAISRDQPPPSVSLSRDSAQEARAAAALLGTAAAAEDQGGGLFRYRCDRREALFRSGGGFEAGGVLASAEKAEDFCRDFCRKFSYGEPDFQIDSAGNGSAAAIGAYGGLPVFNCVLTFTIEDGAVTRASGILLPEAGTPAAAEEEPLTAAGALTAFQQMRRENMVVASSVTDTRLCYELQASGAAMTLTPAWKVSTDTADYYVNCCTGAVTAG